MTENLVCRVPAPEELSAEYRGLTFAAFAQLSDEEVARLQQERRLEAAALSDRKLAEADRGGEADDSFHGRFWERVEEASVFLNFMQWRRYGIPDRDMAYEEVMQRTRDVVGSHIRRDHDFGRLRSNQLYRLPRPEYLSLQALRQYFQELRDPFAPYVVNEASLYNTMRMNERAIGRLVGHRVLEPLDEPMMGTRAYLLAGPYTNWLLAQTFAGPRLPKR